MNSFEFKIEPSIPKLRQFPSSDPNHSNGLLRIDKILPPVLVLRS